MFVRACRSATIRTRLDVDSVRERLAALAAQPAPEGMRGFFANGVFEGWEVDAREFRLDYRMPNPKNPQTYAVRGTVQDMRDWRIVRLKLTAHDPWLGPIELLFFLGFIAYHVFLEELPPRGAVMVLLLVMSVYAFANLLYIPDVVTNRISALIASEVNGSVQLARGGWEVPASD